MTTPPILKHFIFQNPVYLNVDSSAYAIGGTLQQYFQDPDGKNRLHPIAYESKKLTQTEQCYSAQEREMLAAVHCLRHWRHIIEGSEIIIRSDHESLKLARTQNIRPNALHDSSTKLSIIHLKSYIVQANYKSARMLYHVG